MRTSGRRPQGRSGAVGADEGTEFARGTPLDAKDPRPQRRKQTPGEYEPGVSEDGVSVLYGLSRRAQAPVGMFNGESDDRDRDKPLLRLAEAVESLGDRE